MPLYEYQCDACGQRFEVIQKFSDPPVDVCTKCGKGPVQRLLSSPAIQFKGTGWYITDYAKKSGSEAASAKSDSAAKTDTKAADSSTSSSSSESSTTTKDTLTPAKSS
jgi:putative FmdB family regulatory protein